MIEKPTVGMRVTVTARKSNRFGSSGIVIRLDNDSIPVKVEFPDGQTWWYRNESLTEIKENDMYLDEALKAVREDSNMEFSFKNTGVWRGWGNLPDGGYSESYFSSNDYFSSNEFKVREKRIKEVTMAEVEEQFGCKVKVVK